jgi:hypothetical protein
MLSVIPTDGKCSGQIALPVVPSVDPLWRVVVLPGSGHPMESIAVAIHV